VKKKGGDGWEETYDMWVQGGSEKEGRGGG
jgi:hypothetical protein